MAYRPKLSRFCLVLGDEVLLRHEETGISYLPIKRQTANPTDLLGSQKMRHLLAQLGERFSMKLLKVTPARSTCS